MADEDAGLSDSRDVLQLVAMCLQLVENNTRTEVCTPFFTATREGWNLPIVIPINTKMKDKRWGKERWKGAEIFKSTMGNVSLTTDPNKRLSGWNLHLAYNAK